MFPCPCLSWSHGTPWGCKCDVYDTRDYSRVRLYTQLLVGLLPAGGPGHVADSFVLKVDISGIVEKYEQII